MQRINLYRDGLEPRIVPWSARKLGLVVIAVLALTSLWAIAVDRQLQQVLKAVDAERAAIDAGNAEVLALGSAMAGHRPSATLPGEIERARRDLDGRRWLLETLRGEAHSHSATPMFSSMLEALGRQRVEPLWITAIAITAGGAELGVRGRTLDPRAVPEYLQRLGGEPAFERRDFRLFALSRSEPEAGRAAAPGLEFALATRCASSGLESICEPEESGRR